MKRKLTAEQIIKRDARRAAFRTLVKSVAGMSDAQREALAASACGIITVEQHALSLHNTCLVILQCPTATIVGGFRQWIKAGRCVKKGEHGLMIWVPTGQRKQTDGQSELQDGEDITDETRFLMGTVFDVSQTVELSADVPAEVEVELVPV